MGGSPDYTRTTRIMGQAAGELVTIAVDADGQLYALLKGFDGASYVPLSVDDSGRLVAVMTGSDGVDSVVLLTDADGRLVSVIQDPDTGFNVAIDENGFMTSVLKGLDGATLRTLAVDGEGRLLSTIIDPVTGNALAVTGDGLIASIMTGLDGGTLRTLMADGDGRLVAVIADPTTGDPLAVDEDGNLSTVIKGLDGATLRTIAVDGDGNLIGVFKGEFEGELTTLATDEDGNLIAILLDKADPLGGTAVVGNAELAVRLGSPVKWSRTGTVVCVEDFSCGMVKSYADLSGTGASALMTSTYSLHGGYSLLLTCGATEGYYAGVYTGAVLEAYTGKVGYEAHFMGTGATGGMSFMLFHYTGTRLKVYGIRWMNPDGDIYYRQDDGDYVDTGVNVKRNITNYQWNSLKLIVDLDADTYSELWVNNVSVDVAGFPSADAANTGAPGLAGATGRLGGAGLGNLTTYVDLIIITMNE